VISGSGGIPGTACRSSAWGAGELEPVRRAGISPYRPAAVPCLDGVAAASCRFRLLPLLDALAEDSAAVLRDQHPRCPLDGCPPSTLAPRLFALPPQPDLLCFHRLRLEFPDNCGSRPSARQRSRSPRSSSGRRSRAPTGSARRWPRPRRASAVTSTNRSEARGAPTPSALFSLSQTARSPTPRSQDADSVAVAVDGDKELAVLSCSHRSRMTHRELLVPLGAASVLTRRMLRAVRLPAIGSWLERYGAARRFRAALFPAVRRPQERAQC
jgi:hypothetical protein